MQQKKHNQTITQIHNTPEHHDTCMKHSQDECLTDAVLGIASTNEAARIALAGPNKGAQLNVNEPKHVCTI